MRSNPDSRARPAITSAAAFGRRLGRLLMLSTFLFQLEIAYGSFRKSLNGLIHGCLIS